MIRWGQRRLRRRPLQLRTQDAVALAAVAALTWLGLIVAALADAAAALDGP